MITEKNKSSKKKGRVLQDHVKIKSTFYPSFFLQIPTEEVDWRKNIMPELLWLALLIKQCGFKMVNSSFLVGLLFRSGSLLENWAIDCAKTGTETQS